MIDFTTNQHERNHALEPGDRVERHYTRKNHGANYRLATVLHVRKMESHIQYEDNLDCEWVANSTISYLPTQADIYGPRSASIRSEWTPAMEHSRNEYKPTEYEIQVWRGGDAKIIDR